MPNNTSSKSKKPAIPRPSASVILVSPRNEILLLHRVQTSSSFPSAHVFPGGNLSSQDGDLPSIDDPKRHDDAPCYRRGALRELFEESGILLAKEGSSSRMLAVSETARQHGRRAIHQQEVTFEQWLKSQHAAAEPDTESLIPFTHWITPINSPKRYTTQMYLYMLPFPQELDRQLLGDVLVEGQQEAVQTPTDDGGIEVTEARFLPASEWLRMARSEEAILFPPQFLLLHLISQFLDRDPRPVESVEELKKRRTELVEFVHSGNPPWTHKFISPKMLKMSQDGRSVLALDDPGPELKGSDKKGDADLVIVVRFQREGMQKGGSPREVDVVSRSDVFRETKI
ncbi:hypothetical protein ASPZODRAFT_131910 [Penicilliopsis zonata CBS 506.65]|uniref:Nudix hydrolase domain-containing protein n=1 Tax=Penicilliopsis zonata CBS 506.65 TaxID=1073090 RepID=A0A1L9SID9_9EURO|nr:hypothetical protein ASPZODRAFT_131910 [Penicilliopsis zonata CBS 506.65]OJJ46992.1 hypothetical protein ASPZODRAFT_131910 [Penicilliopsis zonata CBS 506.65]